MIYFFLDNPFLLTAGIAGLLAACASGMIGSYVVTKRITLISGSIAHAVLSGMGLFLFLNRRCGLAYLDPLYGAIISALVAALLIGWRPQQARGEENSLIAAIWAIGMAVGLIFTSLTPGYNTELLSFLFGNILYSSYQDILILSVLDCIILITITTQYNRLLALCTDETQARLQGISTRGLYILLLSLVALTIVTLVQAVGIILAITLLTIPPEICRSRTHSLGRMMAWSSLLAILLVGVGLFGATLLDLPAGPTIALVTGVAYLLTLLKRKSALAL